MKSRHPQAQYLYEIKRLLPCGAAQKKRYMEGIGNSVRLYLADYPTASLEELYAVFGTPKEIAANGMETMNIEEVAGRKQRRKKILLTGIILVLVLTAVAVGLAVRNARLNEEIETGYYVEVVGDYPSGYDIDDLSVYEVH